MMRVALPHKGVLAGPATQLLARAGYRCGSARIRLHHVDTVNVVEFIHMRARDVPRAVASGLVDAGISGRDLVIDARERLVELLPLGFGRSTFCYAAPLESSLTVDGLAGRRIATTLAGLTSIDLQCRGIRAHIVTLAGAVEVAVHIGLADAVADVVDTGRTLAAHGLKVIGPPLLVSEAVLTATPTSAQAPPTVELVHRLSQALDHGPNVGESAQLIG